MDKKIIQTAINSQLAVQKPLKIGNDVCQLKMALNSPKIATLESEHIKLLLKGIMTLVGLKVSEINVFSEEDKIMLVGFIKKEFGSHTTKEFMDAFTMAITGRLNVDSEHYQNFSIAYVSRIITAYRKWASNVYNDNREIFERVEKESLPPIDTDWSEYWEDFKNGVTIIFLEPVYAWALKNNKISEPTKDEKYKFLRKASILLIQDLSNEKLMDSQIKERQNELKDLKHPLVIKKAKELIIKSQL